ncbi:MAG TPA: type VII secretion protein EccCa [Jatrophihabitans sp.]|jgi:S-DNA-T family DNA segregation ATPase FtsK/SpoIIIE|nr:type VII secretion protein EccCa [Jatrophihabitans sp.]
MTTTVFRRPPRIPPPTVPGGDLVMQPPPELPRPDTGNTWLTALPALSGLGSVAYMFAGPANPITYVAGSMFLFSSLAMVGGSVLRNRSSSKGNANQSRADYLRYLRRMRSEVRLVAAAQRELALWRGPEPDQLWAVAASQRLWERRSADPDFGMVRLGRGPQNIATPLVTGETAPIDELDPLSSTALRRFVVTYSVLPDEPMLLAIRRLAGVRLGGARDGARDLCRAMLIQAATFHAPDDLRIAICTRDPDAPDWSWAKWLPHAQLPDETDNVGPTRLIAPSLTTLEELLATDLTSRPRFNRSAADPDVAQLLIVIDGGRVDGAELLLDPDGLQAVTVVDLDGVAELLVEAHGMSLVVDDGKLAQRVGDELVWLGDADPVPVPLAESVARQLAGVRLDTVAAQGEDLSSADNTLPGLLGVADPGELDVERLWRPRPVRDRLRTPIGPSADGTVLELDIKEAAQDGMGPHGLIIGATGSGKSELLRTLVLGMATTHSSDVLNLVLVDFKGGATFAGMADLPHVAAVITNLEDDLTLVDRMREALSGELNRRQEVLRDAGNLVSIRDYDRARAQGANLAPLPSLWIVVDEFSELLAQKPDFSELFVQIGRLGRSLGVHLLLASQRIDEGRLRGLESHLSYRIGLRTFSESESRAVLGVSDAYTLPSAPGHGYLKADTSGLQRFRAAYVSGPYRRADIEEVLDLLPGSEVRPFTASYQPVLAPPDLSSLASHQAPTEEPAADETSMLDVMVGQLIGRGTPAHQVWLPPLDEPDTLDRLMRSVQARPERGFGAEPDTPPLQVPVGVVDLPFQQRRDPFVIDLSGAGGNVAIVGGPRSGKSTMLRTILAALALRHTPAEVQFYCLDFSGGALFGFAGLPHVGGVAARQDGEVARRIVAEISQLIEAREARFRELGIDSMAGYRQARLDGRTDDPYGDVFLLVDGWAVLRQDYEDLESELMALTGRALTYGVHLILTANRWLDLRLGLRDLIGGKLELKLGDALDSEIDRRAQQAVPPGRPGRGITPQKLQYLTAVPRIDSVQSADDLAAGVAELVDTVRDHWAGPSAPPVRLLPAKITRGELPAELVDGRVVLGMEGIRLQPVVLDPRHDQGLVVLGDTESGKTSVIRSIAQQVTANWAPQQAKIVLIDYRRTLLGEFGGESVLSYAATAQQAVDTIAGLVEGFTKRLPGTDVTPEQLRSRSWWTGPEVYILVDDYDLVAGGSNPLTPLSDFLPQSRDIGLQLIITRRAGGAGRAMMDPVVGRLRELGQPAIVMSAPRDEGTLYGVRPAQLPAGRGTLVSRRYGTVPVQLLQADG